MRYIAAFRFGDAVPSWLLSFDGATEPHGWRLIFTTACHVVEVAAGYYLLPDDPDAGQALFGKVEGQGKEPPVYAPMHSVFLPTGVEVMDGRGLEHASEPLVAQIQ